MEFNIKWDNERSEIFELREFSAGRDADNVNDTPRLNLSANKQGQQRKPATRTSLDSTKTSSHQVAFQTEVTQGIRRIESPVRTRDSWEEDEKHGISARITANQHL